VVGLWVIPPSIREMQFVSFCLVTQPTSTRPLIATFALVVIAVSLIVRILFDPCTYAVELPYSQFCAMRHDGTAKTRIERVNLQLGLCDFWGRDISTLRLRNDNRQRFMVVPNDFYDKMSHELPREGIKCRNYCLDITPLVEIFLAMSLSLFVTACIWTASRF
jgi:hypothetical protein